MLKRGSFLSRNCFKRLAPESLKKNDVLKGLYRLGRLEFFRASGVTTVIEVMLHVPLKDHVFFLRGLNKNPSFLSLLLQGDA